VIRDVNVVIDFSAPAATRALATTHGDALAGRALVIGTTGLDDEEERALDALATRTAVLVAANFSVGVNLLLGLVERAARVLDAAYYDAEITETHHGGKADAPSGTALALGRAIAAGRGVALDEVRRDSRSGQTGERPRGEIGFHALRGGAVVGEHHVHFLGARERIELAHHAADRALFAEGALVAARWIDGRPPGRYTMSDVLDL
jgi:4-hydroxy-tetrahydrodipicolinate reductase